MRVEELSLFEADLRLLGIAPEEVAGLELKTLRRRFRERSREVHPDARVGGDGAPSGVPSIVELNAAYDAVRKLVEKRK